MTGTVYNTTDGPLVIDTEGHQVDGRARRPRVDLRAELVADALAAGRLVDVTDHKTKAKPDDPAAETKES